MNKLKYDVQKMQIADITGVEAIANECGLSFWSRVDYERQLEDKDGISLVVKDNAGETIGFLISRLIKYKTEFVFNRFNSYESEMEIYNIAVSPAHQSQGAGKILLNKCIESPGDCSKTTIRLEVRHSNLKAVNFYLKNGFKIRYTRKNYYSQPVEDALVMELAADARTSD